MNLLNKTSMRKIGTFICYTIFAAACIGNLICHGFDELPTGYQVIIGGVFVFYFGKAMLEGKELIMKNIKK